MIILCKTPNGVVSGEVTCPGEEKLMRDIREKTNDIFIIGGVEPRKNPPTWVAEFLHGQIKDLKSTTQGVN